MATESTRYCPKCGLHTDAEYCPDDGVTTVVRKRIEADKIAVVSGDVVAGRYRIQGLLGRGGFGAVYQAAHTGTQQLVALKMMLASHGDEDEIRRFYREAQITASLRHPNTVRVFDVGQTDNGTLFIAMELLQGPTLEDVLRDRRILPQSEAIRIAIPVLRSLGEAHSKGLVHRDLKPANIMLSRIDGVHEEDEDATVVKVLDFGIARSQESSLTGQGTALGTPAYMAPEQCQGADIDGRADMYSLAVILYRCICGRPPFADRNAMTVMFKHLQADIPDISVTSLTEVNEHFVGVIRRALSKTPDERFADARDMRRALEAAREGKAFLGTQPYIVQSPSGTMRVPTEQLETALEEPTESYSLNSVPGPTERGGNPISAETHDDIVSADTMVAGAAAPFDGATIVTSGPAALTSEEGTVATSAIAPTATAPVAAAPPDKPGDPALAITAEPQSGGPTHMSTIAAAVGAALLAAVAVAVVMKPASPPPTEAKNPDSVRAASNASMGSPTTSATSPIETQDAGARAGNTSDAGGATDASHPADAVVATADVGPTAMDVTVKPSTAAMKPRKPRTKAARGSTGSKRVGKSKSPRGAEKPGTAKGTGGSADKTKAEQPTSKGSKPDAKKFFLD